MKTKIKSPGNEVTDLYDKEIPKVGSDHTFLSVITLDSALKKNDSYYPQVCLRYLKHIEKKVIMHSNGNLSDFSSSDEE